MMAIAMMLLLAAVAVDNASAASTAPKADWVAKPNVNDLMRCARPITSRPAEAHVTMRCATAPQDHIKNCVVVNNTGAPDARFEKAAVCATKYLRIRAKGPDGLPVMDVPMNVPLGFISSSTYNRVLKAARTEPYVPPPAGTVDEAVIVIDQGNLW